VGHGRGFTRIGWMEEYGKRKQLKQHENLLIAATSSQASKGFPFVFQPTADAVGSPRKQKEMAYTVKSTVCDRDRDNAWGRVKLQNCFT